MRQNPLAVSSTENVGLSTGLRQHCGNRFLVIAPPVSTHTTQVWVAGEYVGGGQDLSSLAFFDFESYIWLDMTIQVAQATT